MAGTTDDFPTVLGNEDEWGDMLTAFFARMFIMSGDKSGLFAVVCNQNTVVCNQNQVLANVPGV
jgi:hypothetical protein